MLFSYILISSVLFTISLFRLYYVFLSEKNNYNPLLLFNSFNKFEEFFKLIMFSFLWLPMILFALLTNVFLMQIQQNKIENKKYTFFGFKPHENKKNIINLPKNEAIKLEDSTETDEDFYDVF